MSEINHVAIILDGNRRFAKKLMLEPWKGHEYGREKVEKLLEWCKEFKIKELTLYAFSMQNFDRPKNEFNYLMGLFKESFSKFKDDPRIKENDVRVNVLGRYEQFPEDLSKLLKEVVESTRDNKGFTLNFAMAYGGREEIVDAIKKIISEHPNPDDITEEYVAKHLYMDSSPDIIIRTGGEKRTSNFLAWQSNYSEWFFLDKTWPEFTKEDFERVIDEYHQRERRFGK